MIPGMCRVWFRLREPDPTNEWSNCWQDMPYAPRSFTDCESLVDYYEGEWGNLYSYCIRSAAWGAAPSPSMPGCPG